MNRFLRILIIIWELPQTLLAGSIIIFLRRNLTGNETFKDARLFYVKNFPGAISLGRFIILNKVYSSDETTKKHEYGHSLQSLYLGWLYLIIVGLPSIIRAFAWKLLKLDSASYYGGYPENWANKLGFHRKKHAIPKHSR
jgi:hypothetical protein